MSHFAEIDENSIVLRVIVAEQDFVAKLPGRWVQTSYNTEAGINKRGATQLRKNFAGVGYTYDAKRDAFIPPKTFPSWVLDEATCLYQPPVPPPTDGLMWAWDEKSRSWVKQ